VGSAVNLRTRWLEHCRDLGNGVHVNRHMQQAWNRYGGKNFQFTILEFAEVPDLLERERAWIELTRCTDTLSGST
jgi:group I intron endonuclease